MKKAVWKAYAQKLEHKLHQTKTESKAQLFRLRASQESVDQATSAMTAIRAEVAHQAVGLGGVTGCGVTFQTILDIVDKFEANLAKRKQEPPSSDSDKPCAFCGEPGCNKFRHRV